MDKIELMYRSQAARDEHVDKARALPLYGRRSISFGGCARDGGAPSPGGEGLDGGKVRGRGYAGALAAQFVSNNIGGGLE